MDQTEEELVQIASWVREQGLSLEPLHKNSCVFVESSAARSGKSQQPEQDFRDTATTIRRGHNRGAEVLGADSSFYWTQRRLAQEIQDENDQLRDQLQRLVSLQDLQLSEVAKMLYDQGLTELIHSSPSEQVAYLLVERASLLETSEGLNSAGQKEHSDRPGSGTGGTPAPPAWDRAPTRGHYDTAKVLGKTTGTPQESKIPPCSY
ncbi:hypothetical protein WMY93_011636 [Mugilogobius chulae]|uniref:Uncharacterized protein n=1 Tax=Mugilogobius chulae TaxID=88201 RepID=A0AAW0P386_9GOBI